MELVVQHNYPVSYVPFHCTNVRTGYLRGTTDIDICELSRADLRPVYRLTGGVRETRYGGFMSAPDPTKPRLVAAWNDRFWMETEWTASALPQAFLEGPVFGTPLDACGHLTVDWSNKLRSDSEFVLKRENGGPNREWHDDGGVSMAAKLQRRAQDMVLVNGRLFERVMEPCWKRADKSISLAWSEPDPFEPFKKAYPAISPSNAAVWRAGRLREMLDVFPDSALDEKSVRLEVLDEAASRFADDSRALPLYARKAAHCLADYLHALPRDCVEAFLDIRDALTATQGGIGKALLAPLERLREATHDCLSSGAVRRDDVARAMQDAQGQCSHALLRWQSRPLDGKEWVEEAPLVTATRHRDFSVREVTDTSALDRLARATGRPAAELRPDSQARVLFVSGRDSDGSPLAAVSVGADWSVHSIDWTQGVDEMQEVSIEDVVRAHLEKAARVEGVPLPALDGLRSEGFQP